MKESATAAFTLIRSRAEHYGIDPKLLAESDIHIHVPAGAIPKDGPSAGVAMFVALASLLTNRPAKSDVAMIGEITLRGLVLPIGGLKEKTLAAKRAGIKQVIVPKRNEKDMPDLPEEVQRRADSEKKAAVDTASPEKLAEVTVKQRDEQNKDRPQQTQIAATPGSKVGRFEGGRVAKSGEVTGAAGPQSAKRERDDAREKDDAVKEKNEAAAETLSRLNSLSLLDFLR
jgi:hypothetical protein